ncbi:MAG TPA: hypothetical protein VLA19_00630 [Herpetosiphonaceae bacterium]|nr:hypothetical protein [Herpetosiphonaceae bacterium]
MNDQMRRYLAENWDETPEIETEHHQREEKKSTKPLAQERRQKQKEWGRAISRYHKDMKKHGLRNDKP